MWTQYTQSREAWTKERTRDGHHQSDEHWNCFSGDIAETFDRWVEHVWTFLSAEIPSLTAQSNSKKKKEKKKKRWRKKLKLNKTPYGFRSAAYRSAKQWNLSLLSLLTWTEEKHLLHSSSPCWRWATGGRSAGRKGDVTCASGELLGGGHDWRRSENWVKPWVTWVASLFTDSCKYFHSVSSLCDSTAKAGCADLIHIRLWASYLLDLTIPPTAQKVTRWDEWTLF